MLSVGNCHCRPWKCCTNAIKFKSPFTSSSPCLNAIPASLNRNFRSFKLEISASASSKTRLCEEEAQQLSLADRLRPGGLAPDGFSYKENFTIRCYEVGVNRTATIEAVANLLQEVACNHAQSVGFSTDGFATTPAMRKRHLIWVAARMHIEVYKYPAWGDVTEIETWCQGEGKIGTRRDWILKDATTENIIGRATRFINPVVVAPTVAAVGLAFFSYGFPQVGTCVEISIPQILLVILFALYLRKISIFGHRIFQVYAVPLGLGITWAYAFLLTEAGAYNYKGCDPSVPISNIVSEACRKHVFTMNHCRTDASKAWRTASWVRVPYPFQWGTPTFHWRTAIVMCAVSVIASVDSVGSYHATSLLVASKAPPPGVVSRGIGLEGLTSILAGLWGMGTGATTLTENVHTIAVTKMGSRRAVELGAGLLILISLVGKVGAILASIPPAMVAALLCFMWAMLAALGLSNLRYSETGSSRNVIIVGLSLFLSLSIPAYFQQYGVSPNANTPVPSYYLPYIVASHGPFHSSNSGLNYVLNTLFSLHMVIAFLVAFILDNTVPGSRQERGVYIWCRSKGGRSEPALVKDYGMPLRLGRFFNWMKWVGM